MAEWLDFHLAQGASHFYLFDDNSTDDYHQVLEPYISSGIVSLSKSPTNKAWQTRQSGAYDRGLKLARNNFTWLACIDIDEFLFSPEGRVVDALPDKWGIAGVFVWWRIFGSSGHTSPPEGGVIRNFTWASNFPTSTEDIAQLRELQKRERRTSGQSISGQLLSGKSVIRPLRVRSMRTHFPRKYFGVIVDELGQVVLDRRANGLLRGLFPRSLSWKFRLPSTDKIRINHYWSKSLVELAAKAEKWSEHRNQPELRYLKWEKHLNEVQDFTILKNLPEM